MSVLPIVTGADAPILRKKTKKTEKITKEIQKLVKDMEQTLATVEGIGLAAPQVGSSARVCLVQMNGKIVPLINPEILKKSDEMETAEEGCLSLPGIWIQVPRSKEIVVRYLNPKGAEVEKKLSDLDARVVQHEVDHLDGVLIVDYLR